MPFDVKRMVRRSRPWSDKKEGEPSRRFDDYTVTVRSARLPGSLPSDPLGCERSRRAPGSPSPSCCSPDATPRRSTRTPPGPDRRMLTRAPEGGRARYGIRPDLGKPQRPAETRQHPSPSSSAAPAPPPPEISTRARGPLRHHGGNLVDDHASGHRAVEPGRPAHRRPHSVAAVTAAWPAGAQAIGSLSGHRARAGGGQAQSGIPSRTPSA